MKIIHHICFAASDNEKQADFIEAGMDLKERYRLIVFDISEDDPRWLKVAEASRKFRMIDMARTEFSRAELDAARFLAVEPSWHHGYPEPADDGEFRYVTCDLTDYCEKCGIGMKQKAPFRMKKTPVWGRRSILQLNWIFDEYFVKPDVWAAVFKPFGIGCRPVVLNKNGAVLDSVVQLEVPTLVELTGLEEHPFKVCERCGRKKYRPFTSGFYPTPMPTEAPMFKSTQLFGSGAGADRMVFISNLLYQKFKEASLKGADFMACARSL